MQETVTQQLQDFFAEYERRFTRSLAEGGEVDIDGTARAFTDCFIEANPNGVSCSKNDAEFRAAIPKGYDFYRSIGTQSMNIANLTITPLDDFHAMAKVHWDATYRKKDGSRDRIDFDVIYFLQLIGGKPKVFAYITGDEQQIYQEHGLIPG
jgi:hypothetical protein